MKDFEKFNRCYIKLRKWFPRKLAYRLAIYCAVYCV